MNEPGERLEPEPDLRALYQRLQPLPLADSADDADPTTARVVHWMQDAWRALEAPPVVVPRVLASPRARPRRAPLAVLAVAALVLLLAGAALWRALGARGGSAAPAPLARSPAPVPVRGVELLAAGPDRVELRSGPVRLVLLGPPPIPIEDIPVEDTPGG